MGTSHSLFECMNHQQMIKLKGKHDAALEVKAIIQEQIKEKKVRELQERTQRIKVSLTLKI